MTSPEQRALLLEGDRLARELAQILHGTLAEQGRVVLLGRSLAVNLIPAFQDTLELVSRRAGRPLRAVLMLDERGRAILQTVNADETPAQRLSADDLMRNLLYERGRLDPVVRAHLQGALSGDEHQATRALVQCLKSRSVLLSLRRQIIALL